MNSMPTNLMAQDQVHARLAEAQRERLIRSAHAATPRPVEFHGSTGSFVTILVAPIKHLLAAFGRVVNHPAPSFGDPASGLGKTASHA